MRIFRFICWLRGFHYGWATIIGYTPATKGIDIHGPVGCRVCGQIAPQGPVQNSWVGLSWPGEIS